MWYWVSDIMEEWDGLTVGMLSSIHCDARWPATSIRAPETRMPTPRFTAPSTNRHACWSGIGSAIQVLPLRPWQVPLYGWVF